MAGHFVVWHVDDAWMDKVYVGAEGGVGELQAGVEFEYEKEVAMGYGEVGVECGYVRVVVE